MKRIPEAIDVNLVNPYCGDRYSGLNPGERFIRAVTSEKTIVTSIGSISLKLDKVRGIWKKRIQKPLTEVVRSAGKQLYRPGSSMISIGSVQRLSYHDTTDELITGIPDVPSRMTIITG